MLQMKKIFRQPIKTIIMSKFSLNKESVITAQREEVLGNGFTSDNQNLQKKSTWNTYNSCETLF